MKKPKSSSKEIKKKLLSLLIDSKDRYVEGAKCFMQINVATDSGYPLAVGAEVIIHSVESSEYRIVPAENEGSTFDSCWVRDEHLFPQSVYKDILEMLFTAKLREQCTPLAVKGQEVKINDDEYINLNDVMYLNADYFFELI